MTKLLVATGIFHPESGGPATYLYHLLPELQARGFQPHLLTYGEPSAQDATRYPYPVTRIPRRNLARRVAEYARAAAPLLHWADALYIHSFMLPLPNLKPSVQKVVGDPAWERAIRKRWIAPNTDIDAFQHMRPTHPLAQWNQFTRNREVQRRTHLIVPSHYLRQMVIGWGAVPERVQTIYNALPPATHTLTLTQHAARAQLALPTDAPLLLLVGRLVAWKGIDAFIRALPSVPALRLLIAGDGEHRAEYEALAQACGVEAQVNFLGRVNHERVTLYMRAADYVGLYSGYEGLSHVLLESLRVGTPVIASDKGGNPEVVRHDYNGLLVPYPHDDALAAALRYAYQNGTRARLAANATLNGTPFEHGQLVRQTVDALHMAIG